MNVQELILMQSEMIRISDSILKIERFEQIASTFKWIRLFEKRFSCSEKANYLIELLNDVRLYNF